MKIGYLNNIIQRIPIKKPCQGYYLRWYYNGWHYWFFLPGKIYQNTEGENYRTIGTRKIAMGSGQVIYEQINALRTIRNSREIQLLTTDGWMNLRIEPGNVPVKNNYINGYEFDFIAIVGSREDYYSPVTDVPDSPFAGYDMIYITHHNPGTFIMILTGHGDIVIDWGDGTPPETYTLTDDPLVITHTYTDGVYEHTITIDGEENIETLTADGQFITEIIIPETATSLTELHLPNNELTDSPIIPDTVPLVIMDLENNPLTICEVYIGSQIWMCKNYDSDFPGSKVYNDDEANRAIYGRLYTWNQVMTSGFCPPMWHVPDNNERDILINNCGGVAVAGGKLKAIGFIYWSNPNTGAVDTYLFGARGGGFYGFKLGEGFGFHYLNELGQFMTQDGLVSLRYNLAEAITIDVTIDNYYGSVRLLKNFSYASPSFGALVDYDGNVYTYVTIGTQQWIVQNFRCEHYIDGTPIPNLTLNADWQAEDGTPGHDGAYCAYNNDPLNIPDYGTLYNWYAVNNAHGLEISGWHIPTNLEWDVLMAYIGGIATAGGILKEAGLTHWIPPNAGAVDTYGFKALPGGLRSILGTFTGILGSEGFYWSSDAYVYGFNTGLISVSKSNFTALKAAGVSIRLMRNVP